MRFRPCIDIHNGKVKQIVGGSLCDIRNTAEENFVSEYDASFYARLYKQRGLKGGHVIILNAADSEFYQKTKEQAMQALAEYPQGLQVGGGIGTDNALEFIDAGASHVIVTSYVFQEGKIHWSRLKELKNKVGKEHLVLDLSCRKKKDRYYIVTDRWQKFTDAELTGSLLEKLAEYCDEFLVHAVDVEGRASGIEKDVVRILAEEQKLPVTYAGGVGSYEDLRQLKEIGRDRIDVTVGSALDLFGGTLEFEKVVQHFCNLQSDI